MRVFWRMFLKAAAIRSAFYPYQGREIAEFKIGCDGPKALIVTSSKKIYIMSKKHMKALHHMSSRKNKSKQ